MSRRSKGLPSTNGKIQTTGEEIDVEGRAGLLALKHYVIDTAPEASRWAIEQYCKATRLIETLEAELGRVEAELQLANAMITSIRKGKYE